MTINVSDNNPRIDYSIAEGVTQTVFSVPFEFFEDSNVYIYVDGVLKSEGLDYTLTGGDGSTGTLTFVTATPPDVQQVTGAAGGTVVSIVRHVELERVTDFVAGQDINRAALNEQLDTIVAQIADLDDKVDRTIHLSDSEVAPSMLLTEDRKGRVLAFDATTGDVEAGPLSNDIQTIADNIAEILAADAQATAAAASATAAAASASASAASAVDATNNGAAQVALAAAQVTLAETAKTAAQTAQTAAETAETNAETAESNAATSETNAASSAAAAALSESAADASETAALASQVAAALSESAALASKIAASTSEVNAASSEGNAATYASNAAASATSSASSSASSSTFADASEYWADVSAGYSEQIQSQAYNISTDFDFGDLTVVTGDFLNEIDLDKLTMSRGSGTYNYGVIS